jgi:hypothetical protein
MHAAGLLPAADLEERRHLVCPRVPLEDFAYFKDPF